LRVGSYPATRPKGVPDGRGSRSAELESVLGATPQGFESLILRPRNQYERQSSEGRNRHARLN